MRRLRQVALAVHLLRAAPDLLVLRNAEILLPRKEVGMYARIIILAMAILVHPLPAVANEMECEAGYKIPKEVLKEVAKQSFVVIEIRDQDALGYIYSLFYNRLYMEGIFYQKGEGIAVCEITFAIEIDKDGSLLFIWQPNEKGV